MIKRTFGDVKTELARVAGQTGMQTNDARLREMVTIAQERLCVAGEWAYQYARIKFRQFGGIVCLPAEYEAMVHCTIEREPVELQPSWFEFLEYGPGPTDKTKWSNLGIDLGETPVYRQPGSAGSKIRVVSTDGTDTATVEVTGYDVNGVRKVVPFVLPDATSDIEWSKIIQVSKPLTAGDVVITFEDDYGRKTIAATYRYRDVASFRAYRFPIGDAESKVVHAIVRRRVYPITSDKDELFITNLPVLRLAVKAVAFEDAGKVVEAETCFGIAKGILQDEAKQYKSGQQKIGVNVSRVNAMTTRTDIY
jgi:hypothetical protein